MALPLSITSADRRDDVLRLLADAPEGLSDGELARALGDGVRPQTVNALCRRLTAVGVVERTGTRPIRNRLLADEASSTTSAPPPARVDDGVPARPSRDVLQAWSRTVNVQAAVASWVSEHGGTIRSATLDGSTPARDLVVRLDGDDVHVEVTGWPPDGDRTHPTTIAADWFAAAARAAVRRRDAQPHVRIVVALPDTRRYRALVGRDATLVKAGTEVWFVDPNGEVDAVATATA